MYIVAIVLYIIIIIIIISFKLILCVCVSLCVLKHFVFHYIAIWWCVCVTKNFGYYANTVCCHTIIIPATKSLQTSKPGKRKSIESVYNTIKLCKISIPSFSSISLLEMWCVMKKIFDTTQEYRATLTTRKGVCVCVWVWWHRDSMHGNQFWVHQQQ